MTALSISSLPDEVMVPILLMLDPVRDCPQVTLVCRRWHRLEQEPSLWHFFCLKHYDRTFSDEEKAAKINAKQVFSTYFQTVSDICYLTVTGSFQPSKDIDAILKNMRKLPRSKAERIWGHVQGKLRNGFPSQDIPLPTPQWTATQWAEEAYPRVWCPQGNQPRLLPERISYTLGFVLEAQRLGNISHSPLYLASKHLQTGKK